MDTTQFTQENQELDTTQPTPEYQAHIEADIDQGAVVVAQSPPDLEGLGVLCSIDKKFLTPEHEAHIAGRGLLNNWARACCISATIAQASLYGISSKSPGILFMGQNGQVQFRPDVPKKKKNGKDQKYDSPVGEFDALLPPSPDNPLY